MVKVENETWEQAEELLQFMRNKHLDLIKMTQGC